MSFEENFYTWDLRALMSWNERPAHNELSKLPLKDNKKLVDRGFLVVENEVIKNRYQEKEYKSSFHVTEKGKLLIERYIKMLNKRWPVSKVPLLEQEDGYFWGPPPHFATYKSSEGIITIYDPGVDIEIEWAVYAGHRERSPSPQSILPRNWRPWNSRNSMTPTCFVDFEQEIPMLMDSMGVPAVGGTPQTWINMMYAVMSDIDVNHLKRTCSFEDINRFEAIAEIYTIPEKIMNAV